MGPARAPDVARHKRQRNVMASTIKALVAVSILSIIAACSQRGEPDVVIPVAVASPVTVEPVFTGKYN